VLPSLYVDTIAVAGRGAWPLALWDEYPADEAEIARYAAMARSEDGFRAYLSGFLTHRKQVA
jgi:glutaconate CoA-transferase subunit A